jgi:hypothetical protein
MNAVLARHIIDLKKTFDGESDSDEWPVPLDYTL